MINYPLITGVNSICLLTHQSKQGKQAPTKRQWSKIRESFLFHSVHLLQQMESHKWKPLILNIYERKSAQSEDQIKFQQVIIKPVLRDTLWMVTDILGQLGTTDSITFTGTFLKINFCCRFYCCSTEEIWLLNCSVIYSFVHSAHQRFCMQHQGWSLLKNWWLKTQWW